MHVIKDGQLQRYLMFYEAVAADVRRSVGVAASQDGIRDWKRLDRCAFPRLPSRFAAKGLYRLSAVLHTCNFSALALPVTRVWHSPVATAA